jgi:hypothetical protein
MRLALSTLVTSDSRTLTHHDASPVPSEDSSRQVIYDCRWPIVELRSIASRRVTSTLPKVRNRGWSKKMLNMKIDPEMYMKTKDRLTQWPIIIRAFVPGLHPFRENRTQSTGLLGRKCAGNGVTGAKPGPKSAHRFIGPSIHRLSPNSFLGGPISPRSDEPIVSPFHYVLANKRG